MQQKHYMIGGIVIMLVIMGIIFISISSFKNAEPTEPLIALSPYIEFEGTIISLLLDESGNYSDGSEITSAPNDSAVIRIDKIIETGGSYNFDWTSLGIVEGQEVSLNFKYTARPAKIIKVVGETIQSGDTVSHTVVPTKITFKNGYFVFRTDGSSNNEVTLPGLKVGSKFKTKVWHTYEIKIEEYNVLD